MKEVKRDRKARGERRPSAREGRSPWEIGRDRGRLAGAGPCRRLREHAGAAGNGGEHRHQPNI